MPINGTGWELHVVRLGVHVSHFGKRTYGEYQAYQQGKAIAGLSGNTCECIGPGDLVRRSGKRVAQGRYPLSTQFGRYRTIGYSQDAKIPGKEPMPAILLEKTGDRCGILIHPGHPDRKGTPIRPGRPPGLYLSSIGCLNPTAPLGPADLMNFWDSRSRVIALIDYLRNFAPAAFQKTESTAIDNAWAVIDGEPANALAAPEIA